MNANGLNEVRLTSTKDDEFAPAYAPTGGRIAFNRATNDGKISVWTMKADGTNRVRRTFAIEDFFPDWQPV
jgi:hypothetical protein